jgi:hypothetical protein
MASKFHNDPRLEAAINAIPEDQRIPIMEDVVSKLNGYSPKALDEGMGRNPSNAAVEAYIATEGHTPEVLPDIILALPDRALVREEDRSSYFKLVKETGKWFCGCGKVGCAHKLILIQRLKERGA